MNWFTNFLYQSVFYLLVQASYSTDESEPFIYLFCPQALSLSNRDKARCLIEKGRGWLGAGVLEIFGIGISIFDRIEISTIFRIEANILNSILNWLLEWNILVPVYTNTLFLILISNIYTLTHTPTWHTTLLN